MRALMYTLRVCTICMCVAGIFYIFAVAFGCTDTHFSNADLECWNHPHHYAQAFAILIGVLLFLVWEEDSK